MRDGVALTALVVAGSGVVALLCRRRDVAAVIALAAGTTVGPAALDLVALTPRAVTGLLVPAAVLLLLAGAGFGIDLRRDLATTALVATAAVAGTVITAVGIPLVARVLADLVLAPILGATAGLHLVGRDRSHAPPPRMLLIAVLVPVGLVVASGGSGLLAPLATGVVASRRERALAVQTALLPLADVALFVLTVAVGIGLGAVGPLPAGVTLAVAAILLVVHGRPAPADPLLPLPAATLGVLAAVAIPATAAVPRTTLVGVGAVAAVALLTVRRSPAVPDRIQPRSTRVAA